ncbi:MAG: Multi-sensor signal transduction histidine kinase [Verrucomicrobiales bacterium]|nr:Multi-sensor signal transduction histidine kinase [Verrucomicrobiales bacterium]
MEEYMGADPKINILMVDDLPDKLTALEAVLSNLGQNIVKANSGKDALRHLLKERFAVILLDVNMPGMDGFETATMIRKRRDTEHTPIIFVTSINTTDTHVSKGYSLGAVDYIFTPVVPEILRAKVEVFVELAKKTEEARVQAEQIREIEEKEHLRKLNEARERLELETTRNRFFTLAADMLAISNFDCVFQQLNPAWSRILGFSEAELKSRQWTEFVHPDDLQGTCDKLAELKKTQESTYFENRFKTREGGLKWLGWTITPSFPEKLLYLFARDITERKKVEQALQETNTELESFSYTVSHDLRAPLRAMQGFADALLQDYAPQLDDTARDYATRIVVAARRMDALIQDLLVYSRLNRAELHLKPVELTEAINDALTQLEDGIREKKAKIEVVQPLPQVCAHHATLVQVIVNLLGNGMKFMGADGHPEIRIHAEPISDKIRLYVKDNGIGIKPEYFTRIFRVFERLHGVETYPGTGIGLAIVRKGIERMGGRVGLESQPDHGSTFWIELNKNSNGATDL